MSQNDKVHGSRARMKTNRKHCVMCYRRVSAERCWLVLQAQQDGERVCRRPTLELEKVEGWKLVEVDMMALACPVDNI